jgi:glycosyltransferase involved in cell wall biosynthesis
LIYICIPAKDEEPTLGVLLWKIRKVMAGFGRDYHIVVLDDASSDGTPQVLERYRKVLPLTVLRNEQPQGYARSIERLMREAVVRSTYPKRDAVVVLQGDFTEDPADVVPLVKALEGGADIVAGALHDEGGRLPGSIRWARRLAPWVLGKTHRGAPASDPLTGFRAYRVIVLRKMLRDAGEAPLLHGEGWAANLEVLGLAAPHARRIEETPLELRYHLLARDSRFRPVKALRALLSVRRTTWPVQGSETQA